MARRETETVKAGQFDAIDENGEVYTIVMFRTFTTTYLMSGEPQQTSSLGSMVTTDGENVNFISAGVYEVLGRFGTKIRVTSSDPKAPQK